MNRYDGIILRLGKKCKSFFRFADADGHLSHLDLHLLGVHQIPRAHHRVLSEGLVVSAAKGLRPLLRDPAVVQHPLDRSPGHHQGLRLVLLLVLGNHIAEGILHRLDHLAAALLLQGVP